MAEAQPVRLVDRAGERLDDLGRRQDGERPAFEVFAKDSLPSRTQRPGIRLRHDDRTKGRGRCSGDAAASHRRRGGRGHRLRGPIPLRFDHFQGDATIPRQLTGLVDHACPTASQDTEDSVPWDRGERGPPRRRVRLWRGGSPNGPSAPPSPIGRSAGRASPPQMRHRSLSSSDRSAGWSSSRQRWPCGQTNSGGIPTVIAEVLPQKR